MAKLQFNAASIEIACRDVRSKLNYAEAIGCHTCGYIRYAIDDIEVISGIKHS